MLENEIHFELNSLENKLSNLLEKYNELKNKIEKLNLEKEDAEVQLSIKKHELKMFKTNKTWADGNEDYLNKKIKLKEEINKNIREIDNCIDSLSQS